VLLGVQRAEGGRTPLQGKKHNVGHSNHEKFELPSFRASRMIFIARGLGSTCERVVICYGGMSVMMLLG